MGEHDISDNIKQTASNLFYDDTFKKITILTKQRKFKKSEELIKEVLKRDPESSLAYLNYALIEFLQSNNKKALEYIKIAINLNPDNSKNYHLKSLIFLNDKKYYETIKITKQGLLLNPNNAGFFYILALSYNAIGNDKKAKHFMETGLSINPEHISLLNLKAEMLFLIDESDTSKKIDTILKKSLEISPEDEDTLLLKVRNLINKDNYKEARVILRSLLKENPNNQVVKKKLLNTFKRDIPFASSGFKQFNITKPNLLFSFAIFIPFILTYYSISWFFTMVFETFFRMSANRNLLSKLEIQRSNSFLISISVSSALLLIAIFFNNIIYWKIFIMSIVIFYPVLAFFSVENKKSKKNIIFTSLALILLLLTKANYEILGYILYSFGTILLFVGLFTVNTFGE